MCGGCTARTWGSPTRRRGVCPGHPLSLRSTLRSCSGGWVGGADPVPAWRLPWGCMRPRESHLRDTVAALPGLARSPDSRGGPPPPSPSRAASASFLCLHPHPFPSVRSSAPEQRSAGRSLVVGSGQVLRASARDGQPLHQRRGHRGLEPAECGHPRHARGGVSVLQVRTRLGSLPFIRGLVALG